MITITWDERNNTTRNPDPDDSWDRGDTRTEVSNFKATWSNETAPEYSGWGNAHKLATENTVPGDVVYATIVQYSTGDTFGHDAGARVEVLGVFTDPELAKGLELKAANHERSTKNNLSDIYSQFQLEYLGETIHVGWTGYFEHLDRVWVETLVVQA